MPLRSPKFSSRSWRQHLTETGDRTALSSSQSKRKDSKRNVLINDLNIHSSADRTTFSVSVQEVIEDPSLLSIHLQPIVDMVRGVSVGYEALSRFPFCPQITYPQWFAEAKRLNLSERLEALAISNARLKLPELPSSCFISVNVTPSALNAQVVKESLSGSLDRVAIELTGHIPSKSLERVSATLAELRSRGAIVALDDTGVDYLGLKTLEALKPEIVKLDRSLIKNVDKDPIKQALIRMVSEVVERIGGWLLAVGIEAQDEIATLIDLKVPLGQGWALGKPQDQSSEISSDLSRYISDTSHDLINSATYISLRSIAKEVRLTSTPLESKMITDTEPAYIATVDEFGQPTHLYRRNEHEVWQEIPITVLIHPDEEPYVVAKRLLSRDEHSRFAPALCLGPTNEWDRIIEVDTLFEKLAQRLEESALKLKHSD